MMQDQGAFRDQNLDFLPLVDQFLGNHPCSDLQDVCLIGAQHLTPSTYGMFSHLLSAGLPPENVHLIGKCYSTDMTSLERLRELGINASPLSESFDSWSSWDTTYRNAMTQFLTDALRRAKGQKYRRLILLDDGGDLIRTFSESFAPHGTPVVGIEQTTAGYRLLSSIDLNFPVINLARSWMKCQYESPVIADVSARCLDACLDDVSIRPENGLIFGFGTIGQAIAKRLSHQIHLTAVDPNSSSPNVRPAISPSDLSQFDLILGCTGHTTIPAAHHQYLGKGTVLASLSSSDREFEAVSLRKTINKTANCHEHLNIQGIHLLKCGFPVTFHPDTSLMDTIDFQITRALISASLIQATTMDHRLSGIIPLSEPLQRHIEELYLKIGQQSPATTYDKAQQAREASLVGGRSK